MRQYRRKGSGLEFLGPEPTPSTDTAAQQRLKKRVSDLETAATVSRLGFKYVPSQSQSQSQGQEEIGAGEWAAAGKAEAARQDLQYLLEGVAASAPTVARAAIVKLAGQFKEPQFGLLLRADGEVTAVLEAVDRALARFPGLAWPAAATLYCLLRDRMNAEYFTAQTLPVLRRLLESQPVAGDELAPGMKALVQADRLETASPAELAVYCAAKLAAGRPGAPGLRQAGLLPAVLALLPSASPRTRTRALKFFEAATFAAPESQALLTEAGLLPHLLAALPEPTALRALVNLVNENAAAAELLGPAGLDSALELSRGEHSQLALTLLINAVEHSGPTRALLLARPALPRLVASLGDTLESGTSSVEAKVCAGYEALLLGLLARDPACLAQLQALLAPRLNLVSLVGVIVQFIEFQADARLITEDSYRALQALIAELAKLAEQDQATSTSK